MAEPSPLHLSPERLEQLTDAVRLQAALYPSPKSPSPQCRCPECRAPRQAHDSCQ